jgi:hypothetical protein
MSFVCQALQDMKKPIIFDLFYRNLALYWGNMDENQISIDKIFLYANNSKF